MWTIALIALVVICVVVLITLGMFFWRLRAIGSRVGSFECSLLENDRWRAGIATYSQNYLNWHKVISLARTPNRRFNRREFQILGREPAGPGSTAIGIVRARCVHYGEAIQIAADNGAVDGLVSWLEASPPQSQS